MWGSDYTMSIVPSPCPKALWSEYRRAVVDGERDRDHAISAWCYEKTPKRKAARTSRKRIRAKLTKLGLVRPGEEVHHRNGDATDNSFANLEILTASAHRRRHMAQRRAKAVK